MADRNVGIGHRRELRHRLRVRARAGARRLARRSSPAATASLGAGGAAHRRESGDGSIGAAARPRLARVGARASPRDRARRRAAAGAGLQCRAAGDRGPRLSADGYEITFAVNHLGHFLLTNLLLRAAARERAGAHRRGRLRRARSEDADRYAEGRGHRHRRRSPPPAGRAPGEFNGRLAYVNSKLCNLWFTYELGRRIEAAGSRRRGRPLTVNGFDPGLVPGSGPGARLSGRAALRSGTACCPALARAADAVRRRPSTRRRNPARRWRAWCSIRRSRACRASTSRRIRAGRRRRRPTCRTTERRAAELWEASVRMARLTQPNRRWLAVDMRHPRSRATGNPGAGLPTGRCGPRSTHMRDRRAGTPAPGRPVPAR